ncbi:MULTISPECIES: PDR/VanB family oxidoreductase [Chromohalobacter]|uniref:PDR/VanB family oxidoreductase n=1 Tax=Chromohalobacter TaxID=42054 RepID=UPI000D715182|nr:PDR/VanB family oxidoreductase [Chromohalobacter salexigens]PWW37769.1 ferredoxin-NADP reductase [Chromohalobacter salexigens]
MTATPFEVVIDSHQRLSSAIYQIELVAADGAALPPAPAGAHLEVRLPNGLIRHYSLLDDARHGRYRIGVLHDPASRGGSAFLAEQASVGTQLCVSAPRDRFPLADDRQHYRLIGGGIGITPLVAMARRLVERGDTVEVHYLVRHRDEAAFLDELRAFLPASQLHLHASATQGRLAPRALLGDYTPETGVYACGPEGLLDALTDAARAWPPGALQMERFRGASQAPAARTTPCRIELARSDKQFTLAEDETLLDGLARAGAAPDSLCCEGACGTCGIPVLEGEVEHRDVLQSDAEKAANDIIYVCVSRPKGERLVLDL